MAIELHPQPGSAMLRPVQALLGWGREGARWVAAHRRLGTLIAAVVLLATTAVSSFALGARSSTQQAQSVASLQFGSGGGGMAPATPPAGSVTSTASVVVIGDSHAWLWAAHDSHLVDLGVPGTATPQILGQVEEALAMHPRYVVISAGTNDLNEGLGWTSAAHNLSTMVNEIKAAGATPILLLIPQYGTGLSTAIWAKMGVQPASPATLTMHGAREVPSLNDAIRAFGVPLLKAPSGETIDGVHLNAAAYASLSKQLRAITG